ncbi:DUF4833 domain-containing protein [Marinifilum flexuosum]|uniref:DUF4833 domain-containing protein n=1 Tax=Marinifilum flexuosum TaxID=1117708 RepID=UPI00249368B7|nr:DUF4833 domain-containing protein [Marinifilum flexuosum]
MNLLLIFLSILTFCKGEVADYPVPDKKEHHLFYIQRTHNTNTVVYEANFMDNGQLNEEEPIVAYWILYEKNGKTEPLTKIEKSFAYGVKHKARENHSNEYDIHLVSYKNLKLILKQVAPFKAEIFFQGNNREEASLDHIFIHANNAGLWTKVDLLEVYTHLPNSDKLKKENITIN